MTKYEVQTPALIRLMMMITIMMMIPKIRVLKLAETFASWGLFKNICDIWGLVSILFNINKKKKFLFTQKIHFHILFENQGPLHFVKNIRISFLYIPRETGPPNSHNFAICPFLIKIKQFVIFLEYQPKAPGENFPLFCSKWKIILLW